MFDDPRPVTTSTRAHYLAAIRAATNGIQQQLRRSYDKATMKDTDENHFILWAAEAATVPLFASPRGYRPRSLA